MKKGTKLGMMIIILSAAAKHYFHCLTNSIGFEWKKASELVLGSVHQSIWNYICFFKALFLSILRMRPNCVIVSKRGGSSQVEVVCSQHLLLVVMVVNEFVAVLYLHM